MAGAFLLLLSEVSTMRAVGTSTHDAQREPGSLTRCTCAPEATHSAGLRPLPKLLDLA